jgi:thioester reductase-like protein
MTRTGYDEVVLLTGFPSFGARAMCDALVRSSVRTLVYAIVEPTFEREAREVRDTLTLGRHGHLELLEGNAAAMDFGLSGSEWKTLARDVDIVHHMATTSSAVATKAIAESRNLGGARELIEFVSNAKRLQCALFHSSAFVAGDRTGPVLEDELDEGQSFRTPAEETLARAEKWMRAAMGRVPIAVVRPTLIVGDGQTGRVEKDEGPYAVIAQLLHSAGDIDLLAPSLLGGLVPLVPVGYYVQAARTLGRHPHAKGRTFHIGDPSPLTLERALSLVAMAGEGVSTRGFFPSSVSRALLRAPGLDRVTRSPRALVSKAIFQFANLHDVLPVANLSCPAFESYVDALVEYVQLRLLAHEPSANEHDAIAPA